MFTLFHINIDTWVIQMALSDPEISQKFCIAKYRIYNITIWLTDERAEVKIRCSIEKNSILNKNISILKCDLKKYSSLYK